MLLFLILQFLLLQINSELMNYYYSRNDYSQILLSEKLKKENN